MVRKLLQDPYLERGVLLAGDMGAHEQWDSDSYVEIMKLEDVTSKLTDFYPGVEEEQMMKNRSERKR